MALLSLEDAKTALGITLGDNDQELQEFCDAADIVIGDIIGGPVGAGSFTQTFDGGEGALILNVGDVAVTGVTVDGTASTDFTVNAAAGIVYFGLGYTTGWFPRGRQNIVVTYTAGSDTVPANLHMAAVELVRFWWEEGRNPAFPNTDTPGAEWSPEFSALRRKIEEMCAPQMRGPVIA